MLRPLALISLIAAAPLGADTPRPPRPWGTDLASSSLWRNTSRTPGIRIWTTGDDLVRRGERVRVFYRTERDAYVTIFRVDTDGRVRVLFPRYPQDENYGYGGATYSVSGAGTGTAFYVDDPAGVGYIFGVASTAPFDYDRVFNRGHWDLDAVGGDRVHGDPLTSLEELSQRLLPESFGDFDTHLLPYYVEQRYSYPRFVCYDCHSYVPWFSWDPYRHWCRRYTLVVWNDPYYYYPSYWYPTRYYGGTRVVYTSPGGSRYVFKSRDNAAPGIDYRDRRTTPTSGAAVAGGRRVDDRGVRAGDIGGVGSIPTPRGRRVDGSDRGDRGDGGNVGQIAPGAIADGRRRAGSDRPTAPDAVPADQGTRRRPEASPGIEIVPGPGTGAERPSRPSNTDGRDARPSGEARPSDPRRRQTDGTSPAVERPAPADQPILRQGESPREDRRSGDEPRPPRPDDSGSRPAPIEVRRTPESRAPEPRAPESRPESSRPAAAPRPERSKPEAQPAPKPERSQPESRPERSAPAPRESRPQAAPSAPRSSPPAPPAPASGSRRRDS